MNKQFTRRQVLLGMAASAAAIGLAACSPKAEPTPTVAPAESADKPTEQPAAAAEKVQVTFWSSFSGTNGEAETELVRRFNESQDTVNLDYQFQGSYEECAQKLTAALQAKTAPELCILSDVWWFKFYTNQTIVPLDDFASAIDLDFNDYQDSLINEGLRQGKHWWLPFARSTPLFYYNRELWEEAGLPDRGPETWDELIEWAPELTKKEGGEVKVIPFVHPNGASYIAWLFQCVAWQFGGKFSDPDFTMHMTDENTIRAGQFYADSVHVDGWALPATDVASDFLNGLAAATMMSTGSMGGVRANATFDFGTAYLPKKDQFGCCTGGSGMAVMAGASAEKQAGAFDYAAFASSPESTIFWSKSSGYMPVRKSALDMEEMKAFFAEFPQFETAVTQLAQTNPQDSARVWVPNGDQIIGKGLERITVETDDVATAFADVQQTLETEAAPVVEALKAVEG